MRPTEGQMASNRKFATLDQAQESFRASPNFETAAHYRKIAAAYHKDEMVGRETLDAALRETAGFVWPDADSPPRTAGHTPGPWFYGTWAENESDAKPLACLGNFGISRHEYIVWPHADRARGPQEADARLMAAAPELAAALLAMHPHLVRNARVLGDTQTEPFLQQVESALRKAGVL